MTRTALIIGGGIAGPVTAMALQKAGFDAAVCEAHPERLDGEGGGFSLAPNGLAALDALDLGDLVRPAGREIAAYALQDWKGRPLAEFGNPPGIGPMQFFYRSSTGGISTARCTRRRSAAASGSSTASAWSTRARSPERSRPCSRTAPPRRPTCWRAPTASAPGCAS